MFRNVSKAVFGSFEKTFLFSPRFFSSAKGSKKVVVVGASGGIGQPLSMLLKIQLPQGSTLSLYDVANTPGVGMDISHINTSVKVESYLGDSKNPKNAEIDKALKGADLVIIPAGVPRKPGMTRDDLFKVNAGIVRDIADAVARNAPKAWMGIITNPVNSTVPVAAEILKKYNVYNPKTLFGVSTLDVVRAQAFVGELKNIDSSKVQINVVGGHSPDTMIPVFSQYPEYKLSEEHIKKLTTDIKEAGTYVVNAKQGTGSATLSMAFAGARFALNLVKAMHGERIVECTYIDVHGNKGDSPTQYFALPVELGVDGVAKVLPLPKLNEFEQTQLKQAVDVIKKNIETGVKFVSS